MPSKKLKDTFFGDDEINIKKDMEEDMDMSFVEPKKHHFFAIFFVLILIIALAGGVYYFFFLNTPKKLFTTVFDKIISSNDYQISIANTGVESSTIDYKFGAKIDSYDSDMKEFTDIFNKLTLKGTLNIDQDKNILENNSILEYKSEELLDLTTKMDFDNNLGYLYAKNLLDKVIKFDIESSSETTNKDKKEEATIQDYLIVSRSFFKAIRESLDNAEYKRGIVKVDNEFLKRQTMIINSSFDKNVYTKLLQDNEFLTSISHITGKTITEISDYINKEIYEQEDFTESITIYTTILEDKFVKLECDLQEDRITVEKDNDKYTYEYIEDYSVVLKGYVKSNREGNTKLLTINLNMVEEKTTFDMTLEYTKKDLDKFILDESNAVDYEKITEEDYNKISDNLSKNKAYRYLIEDMGLLDPYQEGTSTA